MQQIINFLNRPYPEEKDYKSYLRGLAMISIFIALFLLVFAPFNLDQSGYSRLGLCTSFGIITFCISVIYDFLLKSLFKIKTHGDKFTLGKWLLITSGLITVIGVFNFYFLQYIMNANVLNLGNMVLSTFLIGLFPLIFLGSIAVVRGEKKYGAIAEDLNQKAPVRANSSIQLFDIDSNQIRYVEAMQNYIRIWYVEDSKLVEKTERSTLSTIEADIDASSLKRCHRSYIVNQSMIKDVKGNAQGLQLTIKDVEDTIPVSRKYVDSFR